MALLLTATMISLVTVGCTRKAPDSPSSAAPAATQASKDSESDDHEEVVLEVQIVDTNWAEAWNEMKAAFENEYPWITLESVGAQQNFDAFISTRLAAQDLPALIKITSSDIYLNMVEEGYIRDVSGLDHIADRSVISVKKKRCIVSLFLDIFAALNELRPVSWRGLPTGFL